MSIRLVCPHCSARGTAPEQLAGRATTCPRCKQGFTVPPLARRAAAVEVAVTSPQAAADGPGVISLILGVLSLLALPAGFCSFGTLFPFIAGAALVGLLVGCFARGNLMVAGLLLNALALAPIVALLCASLTWN